MDRQLIVRLLPSVSVWFDRHFGTFSSDSFDSKLSTSKSLSTGKRCASRGMSGKDMKPGAKLSSPPLDREKRRRHSWTTELDALLERGYRTGPARRSAAIDCVQHLTGWPRHACWDRAHKLGLAHVCSMRLRRWSTTDDRLLVGLAGDKNVRTIAKKLNRSVAAVRTRLRRIKASSVRVRDGFTKTELARLVGRRPRTVQQWIDLGWLRGRYEGKLRRDDTFRISESNFREFWRSHPEEVPLHRWSREGLEWLLSVIGESVPELIGSPKRKEAEEVIAGGVLE